jgi:thioredoxin 1
MLYVGLIGALLVGGLFLAGPRGARSQANPTLTPSATGTLDVPPLVVGPSATATRAISRLASPTPLPTENIPEPLLTLTAFNAMFRATYSAIPTVTPGPSAITLTGKPHFVKFYADWCAPCIAMKPAVEAVEKKYGEQFTFWEIDIDNLGSRPLVIAFRVEAIPLTVLLDAEGKVLERLEGLYEEPELMAIMDRTAAKLAAKK